MRDVGGGPRRTRAPAVPGSLAPRLGAAGSGRAAAEAEPAAPGRRPGSEGGGPLIDAALASGVPGNVHVPGHRLAAMAPAIVLELQRQAGNASVMTLLSTPALAASPALQRRRALRRASVAHTQPFTTATNPATVMRAPGPLSAAQEQSAIDFTNRHYEEASIRILQIVAGTLVTGVFDDVSAQAVANFQTAQGILVDGKVGPITLNSIIPERVAAGRHEHAIELEVDFNEFNLERDTLSVHFDPTVVGDRQTTFEPGRLRTVELGLTAFGSHARLRDAIAAGLRTAGPAFAPAGPRPTLLTPEQQTAAVAFNKAVLTDRRAVRALQAHVQSNPDGLWGPDTVQRLAQAQQTAGLAATGQVDLATVEVIVTAAIAANNNDSAIRLIIDFFDFADDDNLLTIFFDANVAANASTDFRPNEPVRIRVGPSGMAQPFTGVVHTIAHEFEHVRRLKQGIASAPTHEFLGEAIEIMSVGMPEEPLESAAPGDPGFVAGFADDAGRAVANWNNMPAADQQQFRARFIEVRQRVRDRINAGTPQQQALHAQLLADFNAVVLPAP